MTINIRRTIPLLFLATFLLRAEPVPENLLRGIASEDFSEREVSQAALLAWSQKNPKIAKTALLKLHESDEDPEVRKRAHMVLKVLSEADYLSDGQGYLGILMQEEMLEVGGENEVPMGIRIQDVMPGTPAQQADLRAGDMIIALDGKGWKGVGAVNVFSETVSAKKPLVEVKLTLRRGGAEPFEVAVKLGKRPIQDFREAGGDLQKLEERAREQHFKKWLLEGRAK
jgi:hypothetical protein